MEDQQEQQQLQQQYQAVPGMDVALEDIEARFLALLPKTMVDDPIALFRRFEMAHWYYEDNYREGAHPLPYLPFKPFVIKLVRKSNRVWHVLNKFDELYKVFTDHQHALPVKGGVLLNAAMDKVLLITSKKGKTWGFPKGKIEEGEDELKCAMREVDEEVGFENGLRYLVPGATIEETHKKPIKLFIMVGIPEDFNFAPKCKGEIGVIQWFKIDEVMADPVKFKKIRGLMAQLQSWINQRRSSHQIHQHPVHHRPAQITPKPQATLSKSHLGFHFDKESIMRAVGQHMRTIT